MSLLVALAPRLLQLGSRHRQIRLGAVELLGRGVKRGRLFVIERLQLVARLLLPRLLLFHRFDLLQLFDYLLALEFDLPRDLLVILLSHVDAVLLAGRQQIPPQTFDLLRVFLHTRSPTEIRKKKSTCNLSYPHAYVTRCRA